MDPPWGNANLLLAKGPLSLSPYSRGATVVLMGSPRRGHWPIPLHADKEEQCCVYQCLEEHYPECFNIIFGPQHVGQRGKAFNINYQTIIIIPAPSIGFRGPTCLLPIAYFVCHRFTYLLCSICCLYCFMLLRYCVYLQQIFPLQPRCIAVLLVENSGSLGGKRYKQLLC